MATAMIGLGSSLGKTQMKDKEKNIKNIEENK